MPVDPEVFAKFYAGVNQEWPLYALTEEDAKTQERRWRTVLGGFSLEALSHAMKQALRTAKKRPHPADFVAWASEAEPKPERAERPMVPATHCDCGCGGIRWYLLLRDEQGRVRLHAPTVEAMTAQMPTALARRPEARDALARVVGQPMLRLKSECRRGGGDRLPPEYTRQGYEDGIPVYDTMTGRVERAA